jgi:transcription elongation factor
MNNRCLIALAALAAAATLAPVAAQAKTMKECAAEWDKMKAANQTGGMKYRDFTKQCMSGAAAPVGAAPSPATPTTAAPAPAAGAATTTAKPATGSPGRQAMIARERACGAEWKADKAAGKIQPGMKWPQFWHECDARKKAQGM